MGTQSTFTYISRPWTWHNSNPTTRENSLKIGPPLLLLFHVIYPLTFSLTVDVLYRHWSGITTDVVVYWWWVSERWKTSRLEPQKYLSPLKGKLPPRKTFISSMEWFLKMPLATVNYHFVPKKVQGHQHNDSEHHHCQTLPGVHASISVDDRDLYTHVSHAVTPKRCRTIRPHLLYHRLSVARKWPWRYGALVGKLHSELLGNLWEAY